MATEQCCKLIALQTVFRGMLCQNEESIALSCCFVHIACEQSSNWSAARVYPPPTMFMLRGHEFCQVLVNQLHHATCLPKQGCPEIQNIQILYAYILLTDCQLSLKLENIRANNKLNSFDFLYHHIVYSTYT